MKKQVRDAVRRNTSRWRFIAPAWRSFCSLFLFFSVVAGLAAGVWLLWNRAMHDSRFRMDGETLALAGAIRECPESVRELERIGKQFDGRSLLDTGLVGDMERAYGESVWIKKITRLRRRFPNRMEVEFLLRMPAAQVWHQGKFWMVDLDGTVLPVAGADDAFANLPKIVGATSNEIGRRPEPGQTWTDEGVTGALGIMRAFWGSPLAEVLPVDKVVVNSGALRSNSPAPTTRKRFEVVTWQGAVIRWGTYNFGDVVGELTNSEKLWQLQELLLREEALDPGVCFDVRTRLPGYSMLQ